MTRAVERLSIDWPAESEDVRSKSRFDERFSCTTSTPGIAVFFLISTPRSWEKTVSYRVYSTQI